jgi:hypothetical protein
VRPSGQSKSVKAPCSRKERGKDLVLSATNKSFPKGAVGGVCALNQPDLCQFFMDDNENSLFAVLTEHVLQKYESSTGSIPLTLHHRKGSGARLLLVEEGNHVNDIAHVVVDSSGLLQLPVFKKVADILRVAPLKKNETLKVGCCRWAQSPSTALQGKGRDDSNFKFLIPYGGWFMAAVGGARERPSDRWVRALVLWRQHLT